MVLPDRLILERFRAFAGRAVLPIKPITLVYGPNNSGKSALLRALALLGASVDIRGKASLSLPERAFRQSNALNIAWQGEAGNYSWKLGLGWDQATVKEVVFTLNAASDIPPYINRLTINNGVSQRFLSNEDRQLCDEEGVLAFDGLMPKTDRLSDLRQQMSFLKGRVYWLAGVRHEIPHVVQREGDWPAYGDGEGAIRLLTEDAELRRRVAMFYEKLDPPRRLDLHAASPSGHWFSLNPIERSTWRVHINETGEGMAQVLPVLAEAERIVRSGGILAIEEPESHLHPNAQRILANHLCELAQQSTHARFILETHSRVFLLAVQLAVAQGFPADLVRVVWVDQEANGKSTTTEVRLRENGQLGDGWPQTGLGEDLALARELSRMGRGGNR